jgi:tetratricopeptide (TPR) repeat protein
MNAGVKSFLYLVLLTGALVLGYFMFAYHAKVMAAGTESVAAASSDAESPASKKASPFTEDYRRMMLFGGAWLIDLLGLGLLLGHDLSYLFAHRAVKVLYVDEAAEVKNAEYERVQSEWEAGNYLEAIQMLRDYHKKNPREVHSLFRIAEIYENDLQSYLAAALEYEEILQHKLRPERWGWTAIHLCNLYLRLNKPDRAVALLRRIESEYGQTAAAEKARKRLSPQSAVETIEIEEDPPASCDV